MGPPPAARHRSCSASAPTDELRSYQDWFLRYSLQSVPGVAEVASVGGFEKQYQVDLDPARLLDFAYERAF